MNIISPLFSFVPDTNAFLYFPFQIFSYVLPMKTGRDFACAETLDFTGKNLNKTYWHLKKPCNDFLNILKRAFSIIYNTLDFKR